MGYSPTGGTTATPNVYNQAAGAYQGALGGTAGAAMGQGPNIDQFMNPYTSAVTGRALSDLERQRQMAINTTGAQATQAGAFGGSRHGVAEALTNEAFANQGANTFTNLQQQGFNTALGAAQQQQQMQLGAANQLGNLAQMGYGFGQGVTQQQQAYGTQQQALQQALIDAAKAQYAGFTGAPQQSLALPLAALGASTPAAGSTTTNSQSPGLFSYLALGSSLFGV